MKEVPLNQVQTARDDDSTNYKRRTGQVQIDTNSLLMLPLFRYFFPKSVSIGPVPFSDPPGHSKPFALDHRRTKKAEAFMMTRTSKSGLLMESLEVRLNLSGTADLLHTTSTLPSVESGFPAVSVGTRILLATQPQIYDSATGQWSSSVPPVQMQFTVAVRVGTNVIFGGYPHVGTFTNIIEIYDTLTKSWSVAKLPVKGILTGGASFGSRTLLVSANLKGSYAVYYDDITRHARLIASTISGKPIVTTIGTAAIISGLNGPPLKYDLVTGQHSQVSAQPSTDGANESATIGTNGIFISRGHVDVYDAIADRWVTSESLPLTAASKPAITVVGTKALIAIGDIYDSTSDIVDVYDVTTGGWSVTHLAIARGELSAVTLGNHAYFAGGLTGALTPSLKQYDAVDIYTDTAPSAFLSGGLSGDIGHRDQVTIINTGDADLTGPSTARSSSARAE